MAAIKSYPPVMADIGTSEQTKKLQMALISDDPEWIEYIDSPYPEVAKAAVRKNGNVIQFIDDLDKNLALTAVNSTGWALEYIPQGFITNKMCVIAVTDEPGAIEFVPAKFQTPEILRLAK